MIAMAVREERSGKPPHRQEAGGGRLDVVQRTRSAILMLGTTRHTLVDQRTFHF
jgi:hypothetical protein